MYKIGRIYTSIYQQERVEYFDYLRALAIIPVMLTHYRTQLLPGGSLGVNIFFCLSGFFITKILLQRKSPTIAYSTFIVRRMGRILPLYYIVLTLIIMLLLHFESERFEEVTHVREAYMMMHVPALSGYRMGFLWTLQVEFWFYLTVPVLFIGIASERHRYVSLVLIIFLSIWASTSPSSSALLYENLFPALADTVFFANNFAFGCIAAMLLSRNFAIKHTLVALLIAVVAAAFILHAFNNVAVSELSQPMARLYGTGVALATAGLVCCYASKFGRFLRLPGVAAIGLISYSLYLLHLPVLDYLTIHRHGAVFIDSIWQGASIVRGITAHDILKFLIICIVLAAITYVVIERPSQRLGRFAAKWIERKAKEREAAKAAFALEKVGPS